MWRIGVDLGGTKIEALALSPEGEERARIRVLTPRGDYDATLDAIVSLAGTCRDGLADQDIAGIGIGIPGSLSPKTGLVRNANSTWLNGRPLLHDLQARFPWPVAIENDANCFALSEAADGAARGCAMVFGVILGTGVGGGIVHNGKPLLGHNAVAGEWGHNPLPWPDADEWPGPPCYCGKRGCIETFLSGPALERQYQALSGQAAPAQLIAERAKAGEGAALSALATYAKRLAKSLATVINIADPDVIVLGGGVSNIGVIRDMTILELPARVFSDCFDTPLMLNKWGDSGGVRGAARLIVPR
jgi:fructokinase